MFVVVPVGEVVNLSFAARPTVMPKVLLVAVVNTPSVACNEYVPDRSTLQPVKVATPAAVARGLAFVHVRLALAGVEGCVIVKVTEVEAVVTVLPPRSWIATTGCEVKAVPPVVEFGEVVNPSLAAVPTEIVKLLLVAVKPPSAACSV